MSSAHIPTLTTPSAPSARLFLQAPRTKFFWPMGVEIHGGGSCVQTDGGSIPCEAARFAASFHSSQLRQLLAQYARACLRGSCPTVADGHGVLLTSVLCHVLSNSQTWSATSTRMSLTETRRDRGAVVWHGDWSSACVPATRRRYGHCSATTVSGVRRA